MFAVDDDGLCREESAVDAADISDFDEAVVGDICDDEAYLVDVGIVEVREQKDGKSVPMQYEVDFIASKGMEKYYIQSAYRLDTEEKRRQEFYSLVKIDDSFRKIVVVGDDIAPYTDEHGITIMGLFHFLLKWQ